MVKDHVPNRLEQIWISDITYIKTENDHNYLALVTDAYSKQITGYKLDNHENVTLKNTNLAQKMTEQDVYI